MSSMETNTNTNTNTKKALQLVLLPWLAQGHMSPFINLAKALASNGAVKVWVVSTPVNTRRIRARLHDDGVSIEVVDLELPSVEGLPPGIESTADVKPESAHLLHMAFDQLDKPFESLLRRLSPDVVIHDLPAHWAAAVGAKLGIPTVVLDVYSPAASSYVHGHATTGHKTPQDLTRPPPDFPSPSIAWRLFEAKGVAGLFVPRGGVAVTDLMAAAYKSSSGILIKSCFQEEDKYLQYLREATGRPVVSVGPLMVTGGGDDDDETLRWLDEKAAGSVVFASFGSESFLSAAQVRELALALEDSRLPFLWSLRSPEGAPSSKGYLPQGFEARTRDRGLVVEGWVPQLSIVSHGSVGCYVTHGGWSSVMEAWLSSGLPLVMIPLRHDQGLNCRLIEAELRAGVEVIRDEKGGFRREDVCQSIGIVMGKNAAVFRDRARQLQGVIRLSNARQGALIQDLVKYLRTLVVMNSTAC